MGGCVCACGAESGDCVGNLPWPEKGWPREARERIAAQASEIERLRKALEHIAEEAYDSHDCENWVRPEARAALRAAEGG